jgi:hypothetical protein
MNALVASVIRTIIPIAVGQVASWLLLLNIVLPTPAAAGLSAFLGGLLTAIYYVGVRVLEQQWPIVGVLLGLPVSPDTYSKATATAVVPANPTTSADAATVVNVTPPSGIVPDLPVVPLVTVDIPPTAIASDPWAPTTAAAPAQ